MDFTRQFITDNYTSTYNHKRLTEEIQSIYQFPLSRPYFARTESSAFISFETAAISTSDLKQETVFPVSNRKVAQIRQIKIKKCMYTKKRGSIVYFSFKLNENDVW